MNRGTVVMAEAGSPASQDSRNSSEEAVMLSEAAQQQQQFGVGFATAGGVGGGGSGSGSSSVREQDRFMPIANVIRIMRKVLPAHAKISDDAKETIQECVSEFISFITSEANDKCQREQRKTITAEDVLWAMSKLGFDDYVDPLTLFLHKYREVEGDHRGSIRGDPLLPKKSPSSDSSPILSYAAMGYYKDPLPGGTGAFVNPGDAYAFK